MTYKENQRNNINLPESVEKKFRNQIKWGIYKELYQRDFLTKEQLNKLLDIA